MIRPPIALVIVAALAGASLFHIAFQVSAFEHRLASLNDEIRTEQDAIHVLRAEWTHLNQPARLADLSVRYLDMEPVTITSVVGLDVIPQRAKDPLLWVASDGSENLQPKPRVKPLSPPRFATRAVAVAKEEVLAPTKQATSNARAFDDLLIQILQPVGGT